MISRTKSLLWWQHPVDPKAKGILKEVTFCFVAHLAKHREEPPVLREFLSVLNGKEDMDIFASRYHEYQADLLVIDSRIKRGSLVPCLTSKLIWMSNLNLSRDMSIYTSVPNMNVYAIQMGIIISSN